MKLPPRLFPIALLIPTILCTPLLAQDAPPEEAAAITSADPKIDVTQLEYLLDPLTKPELEVEAAAWQNLVKTSVSELSNLYIEAGKQENEEAKQKVLEKLSEVQDTKTARLKRFDSVLKELEEKGGDTTEYRTYFEAVSGVATRGGDSDAQISAITGWLKSEDGGIKWAKAIGKCAVILIAFWILATILARVTRRITEKTLNWSELLERFINKLVKRVVIAIGVLVALSSIGVNVGAVLALIGGGAFIIGFALQDTLGNFAAGLMLLIYRPFDVGDVVETAGVMGKVDNVSLVSTSIRTPDNKLILVPNKNVWGQVITNATASSERRVDMVFGIGYDDDMAKAQEILEKILSEHEKVLDDPAPVIKVNELADSSVNFVCRPWSKTGDYWDVYWDVTRKVKEEFDANGISIPFPQQDVHMHQVAGN